METNNVKRAFLEYLECVDKISEQNTYLKDKNLELTYKNETLEQENQTLKENVKDTSKDLMVQNKIIGKFESALEEIKNCINTYCAVDHDFINSETYLRIIQELEVLNESK